MVGYLIEQELGNRLPVRAAAGDAAHDDRGRPGRPGLRRSDQADRPAVHRRARRPQLERDRGWTFRPDGDQVRRVVPSPAPKRIFEQRQIAWLLEAGCVVICAGGGGIPTAYDDDRQALRRRSRHRQGPRQRPARPRPRRRRVRHGHRHARRRSSASAPPDQRADHARPTPTRSWPSTRRRVRRRVDAAQGDRRLRLRPGDRADPAVIGQLADIDALVAGTAGTRISTDVDGVITATAARIEGELTWHSASTPKSARCARSWSTGPGSSTPASRRRTPRSCCSTTCSGWRRPSGSTTRSARSMRERGVEVFEAETLLAEALGEARDPGMGRRSHPQRAPGRHRRLRARPGVGVRGARRRRWPSS